MKLPSGIGIAGPLRFPAPHVAAPAGDLRRAEPPRNPADRIRPCASAALLLLHGTADTTVKPFNSERLRAAWRKAGGKAELKLYPEVDHIDIVGSFSELLRKRAPSLDDTISFIDRT